MKIAAVIIVIIVIISAIGIYFLFFSNQDPVAKLQLSPDTAFAGQIIRMDGSNSSDDKGIIEYSWDFGDNSDKYFETADFSNDGKFDGITTHTYETPGIYEVELTVTDKEERTSSTTSEITITELEVIIPFEKVRDSCTYDVYGYIEVDDNSGLGTWSSDQNTITIKNIFVEYSGYMISLIERVVNQEDGFGEIHNTLKKYNYQDVELWGNITGDVKYQGAPLPEQTVSFEDGTLQISDNAFIDLNTNKTIYSETQSEFEVSVFGIEIDSNDTIRSYSNLREETTVFRVEDLKEDRTFKKEDGDIRRIGDILYDWEVTGAQNVKGYPALKIEISIDSNTMTRNNVEEFEMALWITNDIPQPVKTYIFTIIDDGSTEITAEYNNEIQTDGFQRGSEDIEYHSCPASSPDDHYHFYNPGFEFVAWESNDEIPDMGGNSSSLDDYTPHQAISDAKDNSAGLMNYLNNHNDAYVIDGYFNDTQDDPPLWNITFGEKGEETAYYVIVEEGGSIGDEAEITVSEVENSTLDFDPVLTFSSGEEVFRQDEDVNDIIYLGTSDPAWYNGINYGAKTDIIYPTISLTISLTIERTGYGYYINKDDGTFFSAVDAINGQLIYVWMHRGDDVVSLILGGI
jgi:PKD repeat protein